MPDLVRDSTERDFGSELRAWGFVGGWQRTFQGESRRLTLVVSRSLTFGAPGGAAAFVAYVRSHIGGFYPFAIIKRLALADRTGWTFAPPLCNCHLATPLLVAVTSEGRQASWLEINGPGASASLLVRLLAETPTRSPSG